MRLIRPTIQYERELLAFRQEFLDRGDSMDGSNGLRRCASVQAWLDALAGDESAEYLFVREEDDRLVGLLEIRPRFNDFLEKYGGHIGYCVRPSERCKGYAKQMLRAALPHCRELGVRDVLVTCLHDNEASRRTILANGGVFESTVSLPDDGRLLDRFWIRLA